MKIGSAISVADPFFFTVGLCVVSVFGAVEF